MSVKSNQAAFFFYIIFYQQSLFVFTLYMFIKKIHNIDLLLIQQIIFLTIIAIIFLIITHNYIRLKFVILNNTRHLMKKKSIIMSLLLSSISIIALPIKQIASVSIAIAASRQICINNYKANQLQQASVDKIDTTLHAKNVSILAQDNLHKLRPCLPCSISTEMIIDATALSTIGSGYFGTLLATKHTNHAVLMGTSITSALSIPFLLGSYLHLKYAQVNADLIEQEINNPGSTSEQNNFIDTIDLVLTQSKKESKIFLEEAKIFFQQFNKKD